LFIIIILSLILFVIVISILIVVFLPMPTARPSSVVVDHQKPRSITLRGVRTHNLKDISLELPLGRLVVVTGVSGAGKSSLALDTLYAEGQRRYVETFSPYARQFLDKLDKPDADLIAGIPAAIAVGQAHGRQSVRSTVGTITEIHDSLALLYARVSEVICRQCGLPLSPASPAVVSRAVDALPEGARYEIAFPVDMQPATDAKALVELLKREGFTRARIGGESHLLDDQGITLPREGSIDVIVDRLIRGKDAPGRRADSIETAFQKGLNRCRILAGEEEFTYVRGWRCSRCGIDHCEPEPNLFRYNSAVGACPACEGTGRAIELDTSRIVPDPSRSIRGGAIVPWTTPAHRECLELLIAAAPSIGLPVDVPFARLDATQVQQIMGGVPEAGYGGLKGFFQDLERRSYKVHVRAYLNRWRRLQVCPACKGARLRPEALAVKVGGLDIATLSAMPIGEVRTWVGGLAELRILAAAAATLARVETRLDQLAAMGLDYLTLDRPARSLSGGELQRVVLTKALSSGLVNTLYVLDEPTAGLHPGEIDRLIALLHRLRDRGNTLVVVEHDPGVIRASDHLVDLGPGAGEAGGNVVYSGPLAAFEQAQGSATSDFLFGRKKVAVPQKRRPITSRAVHLRGARGNNLKSIDVSFPLGVLCVVTGPSGSGKSTLVEETLFPALAHEVSGQPATAFPYDEVRKVGDLADVVFLEQMPLVRSARSNPVTYLGTFDEIRKTFAATHEAKLRNYDSGRFSFNVDKGRCEACQGNGFLTIDMQFLPDVMMRCPECHGTRYRPEILEITYRGRNIAEVLELTARQAFVFFRNRPRIQTRLRPMLEIGLDYLRLGQPIATLSGGEAQRLKLAGLLARSTKALARAGNSPQSLFLIDEPTAGLHPLDILKLLDVLNSLVDRGHSLIVIEHSPEVMISADWIIELGPGAGDEGGCVVAEGTPEDVAGADTLTGQLLTRALAG
jgi:excinuclease ABC subunit A